MRITYFRRKRKTINNNSHISLTNNSKVMLGVIENRRSVTGEFVETVRQALKRAYSGELNEKERECQAREKEIEKLYSVVWR